MRSYLKKISLLALAAAVNADLTKRDPYWIKMSDVIQQVRPDFYFGVATQKSLFANPKYKDIMTTFDLQVPGNECKFYTFNGSEDFNPKPCDDSIAFAKKFGAKFRGHNLFWPANSPSWFAKAYDGKDPEEVKEYILDYVAKVLDRYKDEEDILYWDVINESVTDDSTPDNIKLRTGSDKTNEFKGWDTYTEDIFKVAREHTNKNVKLFYNDYNAEANNGNFEGKTGAVFQYIKSMKEKGVPIDGVGFQMHITCTWKPSYDELTKLINQYKEIGVEVHITEIDVKNNECKSHDEQKKIYMDVFKACFENENCKVFTVWGAYDTESWVGAENEPLIFDTDMYPKDIYFEMLDYILEQLPADATYPTPTVTKKPEPTSDVPSGNANAIYMVKPGNYMIEPAWAEWSWGKKSVDIDDDGNVVVLFEEDKYGAFSLHTDKEFKGGKLHVELKTDKEGAKVNILAHTTNGDEQVTLKEIDSAYSEKLIPYDVDVPAPEGDTYNRISIQDAWGKAITLTVNNYYFVPSSESGSSETPVKPTTDSNGNRYDIIKEGDFMLNSKWQNWSWGVESNEFDDDGNLVSYITAGGYGGVSFKRSDKVQFGAGTLYFKAKVNDTNANLQVLFHTTADEYVNMGNVKDISDSEMTQCSVKIAAPTAEKYDRITIQDINNQGLTLYLNDVYFVAASEAEEPTATSKPEEPVETTTKPEEPTTAAATEPTTTTSKTEPAETAKPVAEGERYDILKESALDSKWQNWSWGVDSSEFDEEGNLVSYITAGEWGAVSFKRSDSVLFGAGTLYFKAKTNDTNANLQIIFHTTVDDSVTMGNIKEVSDAEMTQYSVEVTAPTAEKYDRITIQDVNNKGLTLYLNDVYFIAAPEAGETKEEPKPAAEGERYDIIKDAALDSKWQNWSWGVDNSEFDEEGNFVNYITADSWGAVSFKKGSEFGAGTLYFMAKANTTNAHFQVLFHFGVEDDDFVKAGDIKNMSKTKMTQYEVKVPAPTKGMYDRITIQDIYNKGVTLYLNDVYFIADPKKEEPVDENCWASALGFKCCKTTKTVVMEDENGSWGVENDFWCGIVENKEETCWSSKLGYPCCENSNVIYAIDASGSWGYENDQWCGITKANTECKFSELGYSCCPDNEVIFEDDHKWGANSNGQWCGVAF